MKKQHIRNEFSNKGQHNYEKQRHSKNSNSVTKLVMIILASLCFFLIVIGILFGAYRFVAGSLNHNNEDTKHHTPKRKVASPKIDVLSQDFHDNYMNRNHVKGYKGFEIGASKKSIVAKYGKGEKIGRINDQNVLKYGNLGVSYKYNKVGHIFVIPKETTIQSFISYHGQATNINNSDIYTFDDNKQNDFMIKVYVENNKIKGFENIKATDNQVDFSDGVKNESEAKAVAKRVLGFRNININVDSVKDDGSVYKVKYGKEDEADQNRVLTIRKTDGLTTGDTTASN